MDSWFGRLGLRAESPRARSRKSAKDLPVDRVSIEEMAPDAGAVLGQAAYLQLGWFEALSRAASAAPDLAAKESLSAAAGRVLAKHTALTEELARRSLDATAAMSPYREQVDRFLEEAEGADWYEALCSIYLTSGLLDDFFARLAAGVRDGGCAISEIIARPDGTDGIVELLTEGMSRNPLLSSRLAVWGRRLVGDTLLVARSALPTHEENAERRIEPVLTELMAEHTRRMDRLGLTA
ncbi:MAG: hypothetical protein JWP66_176 [Naasia sp.]|nr:hypothetical protein [Naasia sp.]